MDVTNDLAQMGTQEDIYYELSFSYNLSLSEHAFLFYYRKPYSSSKLKQTTGSSVLAAWGKAREDEPVNPSTTPI
jgi:hypothetical protein